MKFLENNEKNAKTAKDQIEEQKENILKIVTEKLDERAEEMNAEVDEVYNELHRKLSEQLREMKDYLEKVQSSLSMQRNLLNRGNIEEILLSQKAIDENVEKLRKEEPENLAPVHDGVIQYVREDVSEINVDEIADKMGCIG